MQKFKEDDKKVMVLMQNRVLIKEDIEDAVKIANKPKFKDVECRLELNDVDLVFQFGVTEKELQEKFNRGKRK